MAKNEAELRARIKAEIERFRRYMAQVTYKGEEWRNYRDIKEVLEGLLED